MCQKEMSLLTELFFDRDDALNVARPRRFR
jgi:hypothetical protein